MKENMWTDTATHRTVAINSRLGSPRAWLRKALDAPNLLDVSFEAGSLTPQEITVGAIWYRPHSVPDIAQHCLWRFFDIPAHSQIWTTRKNEQEVGAIGVAISVKFNEIMPTVVALQRSGAAFTWWARPDTRPVAIAQVRRRTKIDHDEVIDLIKQGKTRTEIAYILDINANNVDYIKKKFEKDPDYRIVPSKNPAREKYLDQDAFIRDYENNISMQQLTVKYKVSPSHLYNILKRHGVKRKKIAHE